MSYDIKLASSEDLIDELISRFEDVVFIGLRTKVTSKEDAYVVRRWKGGYASASGLCTQMIHVINNELTEEAEDQGELP